MYSKRKIIDWVTIFVMIGIYWVFHTTEPHNQYIPDGIPSFLNYPKKSESVTTEMLFIYILFPWILLIVINIIIFKLNYFLKSNNNLMINKFIFYYFDTFLRCILFAGSTSMLLSEIIKVCVGRPRPNFLNSENEKWVSFPSLHTSLSVSILFLLSKLFINAINFSDITLKHNISINIINDNEFEFKQKQLVKTTFLLNNKMDIFDANFDLYSVLNGHSWFLLPFWMLLRYVQCLV